MCELSSQHSTNTSYLTKFYNYTPVIRESYKQGRENICNASTNWTVAIVVSAVMDAAKAAKLSWQLYANGVRSNLRKYAFKILLVYSSKVEVTEQAYKGRVRIK